MARRDSSHAALTAILLGTAVAVVGVFAYRRSGRDWNDDLQTAKDWLDSKTENAQGVLEKTERASKELLASAQDYGHQAVGAARGAYEAARDHAS
jgi:hypothetical protein